MYTVVQLLTNIRFDLPLAVNRTFLDHKWQSSAPPIRVESSKPGARKCMANVPVHPFFGIVNVNTNHIVTHIA